MSTTPGRFAANVLPVVMAVILWLVALENRTFDVVHRMAVERPALPESLAYCNAGDFDTVTVRFTGRGGMVLWDQLRGSPVSVGLLSPAARPGPLPATVSLEFDTGAIRWKGRPYSELAVSGFEPDLVTAVVDSIGSRPVRVGVPTMGPVPSRYLWTSVSPETVVLRGPSSVISEMDSVETAVLTPGQPATTLSVEAGSPLISAEPGEVVAGLARPVPVIAFSDM